MAPAEARPAGHPGPENPDDRTGAARSLAMLTGQAGHARVAATDGRALAVAALADPGQEKDPRDLLVAGRSRTDGPGQMVGGRRWRAAGPEQAAAIGAIQALTICS